MRGERLRSRRGSRGHETLATTVSRDVDDGFYELPETLVVEFEEAHARFDAAADAISKYIEDNGLEPRYEED